jgi:hypothetical protein
MDSSFYGMDLALRDSREWPCEGVAALEGCAADGGWAVVSIANTAAAGVEMFGDGTTEISDEVGFDRAACHTQRIVESFIFASIV